MPDARFVLMDEPFGALDAMTRERLQQQLLDLRARTGLTVAFVTHAIEEATLLADRRVMMSSAGGRLRRRRIWSRSAPSSTLTAP